MAKLDQSMSLSYEGLSDKIASKVLDLLDFSLYVSQRQFTQCASIIIYKITVICFEVFYSFLIIKTSLYTNRSLISIDW